MSKLVIAPVSRVEGHLRLELAVEGGTVKEARCSGTSLRGIEVMLEGREPLDAQRFTQRICGACTTAHAVAASLALDQAYGYSAALPQNGRVVRNLVAASSFLLSHLRHFYQQVALDYVDFSAAAGYRGPDPRLRRLADFVARGTLAPFGPRPADHRLPRDVNAALLSHYVGALEARRDVQEMLAVFGGKAPHDTAVFLGGVLPSITLERQAALEWRLARVRQFIDEVFVPDVLAVARAYPEDFGLGAGALRFLSFGAMELESETKGWRPRSMPAGVLDWRSMTLANLEPQKLYEDVKHSFYRSGTRLHPSVGATIPDPERAGAYSFVKAPRYAGQSYEVGPLARTLVAYARKQENVMALVNRTLSDLGRQTKDLPSVMGRHVARALEAKMLADAMATWSQELQPGEPTRVRSKLEPQQGEGVGLTEGPGGALGHWMAIERGALTRYQIVAPTTWNLSPRDDQDQPGPCEEALRGAPVRDPRNPVEVSRIVRSFDPCLACAVH